MWRTYCCCPAAPVAMSPAGKNHHPDEGHDEAEDRDEHDPALRVLWNHHRAGHQDPHQTTKHLQHIRAGSGGRPCRPCFLLMMSLYKIVQSIVQNSLGSGSAGTSSSHSTPEEEPNQNYSKSQFWYSSPKSRYVNHKSYIKSRTKSSQGDFSKITLQFCGINFFCNMPAVLQFVMIFGNLTSKLGHKRFL